MPSLPTPSPEFRDRLARADHSHTHVAALLMALADVLEDAAATAHESAVLAANSERMQAIGLMAGTGRLEERLETALGLYRAAVALHTITPCQKREAR